jgi:hypothetical protein
VHRGVLIAVILLATTLLDAVPSCGRRPRPTVAPECPVGTEFDVVDGERRCIPTNCRPGCSSCRLQRVCVYESCPGPGEPCEPTIVGPCSARGGCMGNEQCEDGYYCGQDNSGIMPR